MELGREAGVPAPLLASVLRIPWGEKPKRGTKAARGSAAPPPRCQRRWQLRQLAGLCQAAVSKAVISLGWQLA